MFPISSLLSLGLTTFTVANAQLLVQDSSFACSNIAKSFKRENVTVNFSQYVPAFTNITFSQAGDLESCSTPGQVVSVDMCRVAMHVSTSSRSGITMEAWLPTNWTGRFLATGNGGLAGCIKYGDMAYALSFGFATVGANNGHNGTSGLAFLDNEDVIVDFAWRSLVTETEVGKAITKAYYKKDHKKSYYLGCSTGGRQGFKMAQDYPTLFDGIVAGAPALAFNNLTSWSGHYYTITGSNTSDVFVTSEKWALVHQDVLRQCDALDGAADGILEDPSLCQYKPVTLQCSAGAQDTSSCLTAEEVEIVTAVLAPYYGEDGVLIYPRLQPGAEDVASYILFNGVPFSYTSDWFRYAVLNDTTWDPATLDVATAAIAARIDPGGIQTWNGDLSAFQQHGGKLLHYHGEADPIISSDNSPRYYQNVATTMGLNPDDLDSFYRFFRISGMGHCDGGVGAWGIGQQVVGEYTKETPNAIPKKYLTPEYNVLLRMVDWVEQGDAAAPDSVTGVKFVNDTVSLGVQFQRRHCKWPKRNACVVKDKCKNKESWKCVD